MKSLRALKARVALRIKSVDLERDEKNCSPVFDMDTGKDVRDSLPEKTRKLYVLMDRGELTLLEYRRLLGRKMGKNGPR